MRNKKNRENTRQRKQSHAQDNIYVVQQFAYVHKVAGISLLSGKKKIQDVATIILHNKKRSNQTMQYYSGRIIKPDQIKVGSTKPNNGPHKYYIKHDNLGFLFIYFDYVQLRITAKISLLGIYIVVKIQISNLIFFDYMNLRVATSAHL